MPHPHTELAGTTTGSLTVRVRTVTNSQVKPSAALRRLREERKLSQAEAAKQIGISQQQYSYIELGNKPGLTTAFKVETWSSGAIPARSWA